MTIDSAITTGILLAGGFVFLWLMAIARKAETARADSARMAKLPVTDEIPVVRGDERQT